MSGDDTRCPDCGEPLLHEGGFAHHVLNPEVFGIVVGFSGSLVFLRLADMTTASFQEYEVVAYDPDDADPGAKEEPPVASADIIDFTKAADLRRAKMRGAA